MTTPVTDISDRFVERFAALDPVMATFEGSPGYETELTDYSPDGIEERLDHARTVLGELAAAPIENDADRVAAEVLRRHLEVTVDLTETGEDLRALRIISSPVSDARICFDLMPRESEEDWEHITARVAAVPHALDTFIAALREGISKGLVAANG